MVNGNAGGTKDCFSYRIPITNFRELGGYQAVGGKVIKHGLFYRSGSLSNLNSKEDRNFLSGLDLKLILDLRSKEESDIFPDYIPYGVEYLRICAMRYEDGREIDFSPDGMKRIEQEMEAKRAIGLSPLEVFASFYAQMPFHNPACQALFNAVETGKTPMLFHCTAGKDRTGVAAMLVLLALGCERETVIADYVKTNDYVAKELKSSHKEYRLLEEKNPEKWNLLIKQYGVSPYLANRALDSIITQYGSWENYFYQEFGLNQMRLTVMRKKYLE